MCPPMSAKTCGEYYLDSTVAQEVYRRAEAAVARNAEVEIVRYAASTPGAVQDALAWIMHEGTGFQGHAYKFGDVEA